MRDTALLLAIALLGTVALAGRGLAQTPGRPEVYQDLEEVTLRLANLNDKPALKLIQANGGFFQNETIIFKDVETGNEVWSLTRELCTDLANIERRTAWSCNGQYISFIGNMAFLDYDTGQIRQRPWAGHSYLANADGSRRRKLWATTPDGKTRTFEDKFNNWDALRPGVLYYPSGNQLWKITVGDTVKETKAQPIYTFPNSQGRIVQEISDDDFMLIEEQGPKPNCYVVNLNKDPKDPHFCLAYPLKGPVHPGSFRFRRSGLIVTGSYDDPTTGLGTAGSIRLKVNDDRTALLPAVLPPDPYRVDMAHLWYGPPDDRVAFFGSYRDRFGLWLQLPGKAPTLLADVPDGHVSWCSHDPEWFFAAVGPSDPQDEHRDTKYFRKLLAGNADGKRVKVICTPFDRRRGGEAGYDAIPRPNQSPDGTKCWFHSSMLMPNDSFTGSYIAVFRKPYPPTSLTLAKGAAGVTLQWTPHPLSHEVKGYHLYRSADGGKTFTELTSEAMDVTMHQDVSAERGRTYVYAVTSEEWSRLESDLTSPTLTVTVAADGSVRARATAPGIAYWDTTAPAPVKGFTASRTGDGIIHLTWHANTAKDLRYYNIYASREGKPEVSQQRLLVSPAANQTAYLDWTAGPAPSYSYAITAVDRQGNESAPAFASIQ